ncbi:MAG: transporter [Desulfovibrio sp.]|jgi:hypothetical protein|nr:transporter [Desulfovibrio sp.]
MMLKRKICLPLVCFCCLLFAGTDAFAGGGHYGIGGEGYQMAVTPREGSIYKMYNVWYEANAVKNKSGGNVRGDTYVAQYVNFERIVLRTPVELFGADWFFNAALPFTYTKMSKDLAGRSNERSIFAIGDPAVSAILAWHGEQWQANFEALAYFPIGAYDEERAWLPGKGFFSLVPTVSFAYYFDEAKTINFSAIARYEYNTYNPYTGVRPGSNISLEYSLGKTFENGIDLAITGANSRQVSEDVGSRRYLEGRYDDLRSINMIGPEIGYTFKDLGVNVNLRVLFEYENRHAPQGYMGVLSLVKVF